MKFLHPEILWALGALAVPIIVHLFNFRKFKKVLFSNVAFLREIKQETQSKSRLKHLLILAARMFAVACIVLAFAQPYIPAVNTSRAGERVVSVYIDNSFSMEAQAEGAPLLELSKSKALSIVNAYSPTDQFQLLTSDFEGRHQRLVSREEMVDLIQEVVPSPATRSFSEVFSRQRDVLNADAAENRTAYYISDLQASTTDLEMAEMDTSILVRLVPTQASSTANLFIDSVWFTTPVRQLEQAEMLTVRLVNTSEDDKTGVPLTLTINGQQKSVAAADIPAGGQTEVALNYTHTDAGFMHAELAIDDHPVVFDDRYYFGYEVLPSIAVMEVRGQDVREPDPVAALFGFDAYYRFTQVAENGIDYSQLPSQQCIVLHHLRVIPSGLAGELQRFVENGGSLVILPHPDADIASYTALTGLLGIGQVTGKATGDNAVNTVNYDHYLFANAFEKTSGRVDLPTANTWFMLAQGTRSTAEPVMGFRTGEPFLTAAAAGLGRSYFWSVSLDGTTGNLVRHSFFATAMLRMAELSQPTQPLSYTAGREQVITLRNLAPAADETFRLRHVRTGEELIPEHRTAGGSTELFIHSELRDAGNYVIERSGQPLRAIAFNFDRRESITVPRGSEELITAAADKGWNNVSILDGETEQLGKLATEMDEGKKYWWSMIIWALIFLAAEVLLIKYWR